jgi:hypothetical protein
MVRFTAGARHTSRVDFVLLLKRSGGEPRGILGNGGETFLGIVHTKVALQDALSGVFSRRCFGNKGLRNGSSGEAQIRNVKWRKPVKRVSPGC